MYEEIKLEQNVNLLNLNEMNLMKKGLYFTTVFHAWFASIKHSVTANKKKNLDLRKGSSITDFWFCRIKL